MTKLVWIKRCHWACPETAVFPMRCWIAPYAKSSRLFRELSSTPGIWRKKIGSLVMLLRRVLAEEPGTAPEVADSPGDPGVREAEESFDVTLVSESVWEDWRETVRRFGMEEEKLGKFASSLRDLPTVIWDTPLRDYLVLSMDEIRSLKTHGDKRVRVVLEVFHTIYRLLGHAGEHRQFVFRVQPRFTVAVEQWVSEHLRHIEVPDVQDIRQNLVLPVLNQIELDAGEIVHRLAAGRLGVESRPESVREQAERMGVTRAHLSAAGNVRG